MTRVLFLAGAIAALLACDDEVYEGGSPGYEPTWLGVQVFMSDHCIECHPSVAAPDLPEETEFYVAPGDPDASVLWRVVSGETIEGDPPTMPFGAGTLPMHQIQHIHEWIEQGAPMDDTEGAR